MEKVYDVAVIGSGPSGLTAAIYTTRGAASTILFAGSNWGGQLMLTTLVENYPGFPDGIQGPDLMLAMRKQAEKFGAEIINDDLLSCDFSSKPFQLTASGQVYSAKSVIIATGAETMWLGIPGEKELIGRGVSSCAPCDAPFFKGKKVAVVGGGDSAMEEALVLEKFASEVTIIHRRNEFRASKIMQSKVLKSKKIKVLFNTEVQHVMGTSKLEKLVIKDTKSKAVRDLLVDGMFVAIGHSPMSHIFKGKIELDEKGYIKKITNDKLQMTNEYQMATSVPGVFVAGDVHDHHYKQAVTAAGFGCMAALEVLRYLES